MKSHMIKAIVFSGIALSAGQANAEGKLSIYTWGNYTNPDMIKKFESAYDIKVTIDGYDSNETLLAKVKGGGTGYDVVVPGDYMVAIMINEKLLAPINAAEMENFKNLNPDWINVYWDPGRVYSVPYQWGTTSFTVDTAVYDGDINTLSILFDPPAELKGRINMLNDMNDVINAGLRYLGYPRCNSDTAQLKDLTALLLKAKADWRTMDYAVIEKLTSKDVDVSQSWNGAAMRARKDRPTLKYAYPKEGFTGWMDNVAVLADAPDMENAKLFINFMMDPENAAMTSNFARYANGVIGSEAFMDKDMLSSPEIVMPAGVSAPDFVKPCSQDVVELYNKVWTRLKQ